MSRRIRRPPRRSYPLRAIAASHAPRSTRRIIPCGTISTVNALNVRLLASRLAEGGVRDALGRYLLVACVAGFAVSLVLLRMLGYGLDRWVFILIVWAVLIFIPLRIVVEALRPFGARMHRRVADSLVGAPRRFDR